MLPQFLKDGRENGNFMFVFGALGLVVIRRTADRQDPALFADRELRMIRLYNFGSVPYSCLYFFFKNLFSTWS